MVIRSSAAREVERLLAQIGEPGPARDAAVARLAVIGDRAVGHLVDYVKRAPSPDALAAALRVLEVIGNGRSLDVALPLVGAADEQVALGAVAIVGREACEGPEGPTSRAVDALVHVARREDARRSVRRAAIEALERAAPELATDLRQRLDDPSPHPQRGPIGRGRPSPEPLPPDIGRADADAVRAALGHDRATPAGRLHDIITAIRSRESAERDPLERSRWTAARAAAHQALAARGSRVALYDLRETLESATAPLPVGFIAALQDIGDASCLDAIAAALVHIPSTEGWWHTRLRDAFAAIVEREGLTRRHAVIKRLAQKHGDRLGPLPGAPRRRA